MNDAAIYYAPRRQVAVSNISTEAEVKAAALTAEVLADIVPLWSELAGSVHPPVHTMTDNKAAKSQYESGATPLPRCAQPLLLLFRSNPPD